MPNKDKSPVGTYSQLIEVAEKKEKAIKKTKERKKRRTVVRTDKRTKERTKARHSFDVFKDQLISLNKIQQVLFEKTGKKPKIGNLVQEALDKFIKKQKSELSFE